MQWARYAIQELYRSLQYIQYKDEAYFFEELGIIGGTLLILPPTSSKAS